MQSETIPRYDDLPTMVAPRNTAFAEESAEVEVLYAELRALDKAGRLEVEPVTDVKGRKLHDRLKLRAV